MKKDVLEKSNDNSMANENCKHQGFSFFLNYNGPCIAGKTIIIIVYADDNKSLLMYFIIGKKKYDVKNECSKLFFDQYTVSDEAFG